MVENSLGRIWMTLHPDSRLLEQMPYYIHPIDNQQDPLPEGVRSVKDIRFVDPCTGSGHVLVYAFDLFTFMYEEEGFSRREIPALILQNNLYGMDIDRRCYQLACFALTMKARAYYSRYLRNTVQPNIIAWQNIDREVIESTGAWPSSSSMWQFQHIDTIGSLLKVTPEECAGIQVQSGLWGTQQQLLKTQTEYLTRGYHCVVTNPPYLGKGFGESLKTYAADEYPYSKGDTMVMFMEQCAKLNVPKGYCALINFQSWMFVYNYTDFRKNLLGQIQIHSMLHLGRGIFGADFGSVAFVLQKTNNKKKGHYYRLFKKMSLVRSVEQIENLYLTRNCEYFETNQTNFLFIPGYNISYWVSKELLKSFKKGTQLGKLGTTRKGMYTGLNEKFVRNWREVSYSNIAFNFNKEKSEQNDQMWYPYANGGDFRKWFGNYEDVVLWKHNGEQLRTERNEDGKLRAGCFNLEYIFKQGIVWSSVTISDTSMRLMCKGSLFSSASNAWFGTNTKYVLAFLNVKLSRELLKAINPTVNANPGDIGQIPLIMNNERQQDIVDLCDYCIKMSKQDWDAHETSWDFQQNELVRIVNWCIDNGQPRNFSLEAILGIYEAEWDENFIQLHHNEEELNRHFIEIYGLQEELSSDVPLSEITILQQGEIAIDNTAEHISDRILWNKDVVIKQLISYLVGCFMGRYSVDRPGLIIASQHTDLATLGLDVDGIEDTHNNTLTIDDDGIIPIVEDAEFFADDMTRRIEQAIKKLFGEEQFYKNMDYLKKTLKQDLRSYLYKDFYADHQQMYSVKGSKRPIYWLFSSRMGDKKKHGYFKALVYMHRMEQDTLSRLHADYVHPYLTKAEQQLREAEDDALRDNLSQAQRNRSIRLAEELREKVREVKQFEQQLVEMASHRMSIDLDDGIKANYPKFYPLVESIKGLEASDNDEE